MGVYLCDPEYILASFCLFFIIYFFLVINQLLVTLLLVSIYMS